MTKLILHSLAWIVGVDEVEDLLVGHCARLELGAVLDVPVHGGVRVVVVGRHKHVIKIKVVLN